MTFPARALLATVAAVLVLGAGVSGVAASGPSISLNVTNGECSSVASAGALADGTTACGGAIAGTHGFSGRIFGTGTVLLSGLVCVHAPGDGSLSTYGGAYGLSVNSDGQNSASSASAKVVGGQDCSAGAGAMSGVPIQVTFPASGYVGYSLSVSGVGPANGSSAFRAYDRMIVRVFVSQAGLTTSASSPSVVPPGPPGEIPESPLVPALLLSSGVLTILVVRGRMRAAGEIRA